MLTEKNRPGNSCYLMFEFGSHHYSVLVDESYFFFVINGLNSEFEVISSLSDDGSFEEFSIINYYGDEQNIGTVIFSEV